MTSVQASLRIWFLVHFVIDMIIGIPLLLFPEYTLSVLGFSLENLVLARVVGAALIGIGGVSFIIRNEKREVFLALIKLKLLWSGAASIGILLSIMNGESVVLWSFLSVFAGFFLVWEFYRRKLK